MLINNRKDLDAAPADERARFIAQISGTIHKWRWDDTEWAQYVDASSIERFEFTLADFPDAPVPDMPDYNTGDAVKEAERSTMVVSKFQAKAALYQMNLLQTVQTHMETADPMAQMAWEDAQEFRRYSPTMNALAVELGMTEEQLDDLFRLAATIEA